MMGVWPAPCLQHAWLFFFKSKPSINFSPIVSRATYDPKHIQWQTEMTCAYWLQKVKENRAQSTRHLSRPARMDFKGFLWRRDRPKWGKHSFFFHNFLWDRVKLYVVSSNCQQDRICHHMEEELLDLSGRWSWLSWLMWVAPFPRHRVLGCIRADKEGWVPCVTFTVPFFWLWM